MTIGGGVHEMQTSPFCHAVLSRKIAARQVNT